jgi:hypothetical protein
MIKKRLLKYVNRMLPIQERLDRIAFIAGESAAREVCGMENIISLYDVEFGVSSQWGEDGIIEWLVHNLPDIPEIFIEFGVENYRESNTRFLLQHRNWRGLVIDGDEDNIDFIKSNQISWRHDITSIPAFITRDNINPIISGAGFSGEIGILSIDIDGVDYWVWEAIECVNPHILIVEYNSAFGDLLPLSVPYTADFARKNAHSSGLYYGFSIRAAQYLANERGYKFVGTNKAGSNAFFIRNDRADEILKKLTVVVDRPSRFRESRDIHGKLTFVSPIKRSEEVAHLPVIDVVTSSQILLGDEKLFSSRWISMLSGYST